MVARWIVAACCLPVFLVGCAPTVEFTAADPQASLNGQMQRIGVLSEKADDHSRITNDRLAQRLRQSGQYEVISENELQQAAPDYLRHGTGELRKEIAGEAGRRMFLDGLVVSSARIRDNRDGSAGSLGYDFVDVMTSFEWVELPNGRILDQHRVAHEEPVRGAADRPVVRGLEKCTDQLARRILPELRTVKRELKGNSWFGSLSAGNRLAIVQDWRGAQSAWRMVVDKDPENEDAWHNLAIASEALGESPPAARRPGPGQRGLEKINPQDNYQLAIERLDQLMRSNQSPQPQPYEQYGPTPQQTTYPPTQPAGYPQSPAPHGQSGG